MTIKASSTNSLTPKPQPVKNIVGKNWREIRHPVTKRLICKHSAESNEIEVIDRGKRSLIELPQSEA